MGKKKRKGDGLMTNKAFEELCRMTQKTLKKHVTKRLKAAGREVESGDGYVYSPGSIPILVCAHLDTVHSEVPRQIVYTENKVSSPQGIGGDDRCGVYMIFEIIKELDVHVAFFEDEEVGGKGSGKFINTDTCLDLEGKLKFVIELDRKGANDAVFYDLDNLVFEQHIVKEFWKVNYGSFTDITVICPALECAGVNLSCGYYNAHRLDEYVVLPEMERAIVEVKKLIKRSTDVGKFDYIEYERPSYGKWDSWGYGYGSYYGMLEKKTEKPTTTTEHLMVNDVFEIIYESERGMESVTVDALSEYEAVGIFLMEHPEMRYLDIYEVRAV